MTEQRIEKEARDLAEFYADTDADLQKVFWFPSKEPNEVRLINVVDGVSPSTERKADIYCLDHNVDLEPVYLKVGVIPLGEVGNIGLPPGWNWREAQELYSEKAAA
jgi:hypothetical protein